jgi:OOP family OmpA-OmpF porin
MNESRLLRFTAITAASVLLLGGCITAKEEPMTMAEPAAAAVGDADGDGVPDDQDRCPNTRAGVQVDASGCEIILQLSDAHFEFDKATLTPEAMAVLDGALEKLRANPAKQFEIAGHADAIGSEEYNMDLSRRRAESVLEYLAAQGADASRYGVAAYGESRPVASNTNPDGSDNPEGRAQNRRVEVVDLSQ